MIDTESFQVISSFKVRLAGNHVPADNRFDMTNDDLRFMNVHPSPDTFAYLTIRMNLETELDATEYMASYFLKFHMGDTGVELKYAHLLDIDTVWSPNTASYLNILT